MNKRTKKVKAAPFDADYEAWVGKNGQIVRRTEPCWSLPRTAEAYDAMVWQMAKAYCKGMGCPVSWMVAPGIIAALRAIGIKRPKE